MSNLTRRKFLSIGASGLGLLALQHFMKPSLLLAQSSSLGSDKNIVVINLIGGMDGLAALPYFSGPVSDAINTSLRPNIKIAPQQVLNPINQNGMPNKIGFHPAFAPLINLAGQNLRVIKGYGIPGDPGRSHDTCQILMSMGASQLRGGDMVGFLARLMDSQSWETFQYWNLASTNASDVNTRKKPPVVLNDLDSLSFSRVGWENERDLELVRQIQDTLISQPIPRSPLEQRYSDSIVSMRNTVSSVQSQISGQQVGSYQGDGVGRSLRDAAKILKAKSNSTSLGLSGKDMLILTAQGGYDTHSDQFNPSTDITSFPVLLADLAQNLAVFYQDLVAMGLLQKTVVVLYSEFGRTCYENGSPGAVTQGTDHGHASNTFVLGGQVNPGISGFDPDLNELLDQDYNALLPHTDYRDIFSDVLQWIGVDPLSIFDDPSYVRKALGIFA